MRYNEEEKARRKDEWLQSGKSSWAYCKSAGINFQTFRNWIKSEEKPEQNLVEIPTQIFSPNKNNQEILIEKGDVRIRVPLSINCNELYAIMDSLGREI